MTSGIIKWGISHPKKLFLADGSGAILSAFLLAIVLVELQPVFGIPKPTLYILAIFPCLFALYDFYCLVKEQLKTYIFMKGIALMNFSYCLLSLLLSLYHYKELTGLGWLYMLLENIIVIILASIEYRVSKELK